MKVRRKGSGRTKGAGSFITVTLNELNKHLRPEATVIISRRFANNIGLQGNTIVATTKNVESHAAQVQLQKTQLEEPVGQVQINKEDW